MQETITLKQASILLSTSFRTLQDWYTDRKIKPIGTVQGEGRKRVQLFLLDDIKKLKIRQKAKTTFTTIYVEAKSYAQLIELATQQHISFAVMLEEIIQKGIDKIEHFQPTNRTCLNRKGILVKKETLSKLQTKVKECSTANGKVKLFYVLENFINEYYKSVKF